VRNPLLFLGSKLQEGEYLAAPAFSFYNPSFALSYNDEMTGPACVCPNSQVAKILQAELEGMKTNHGTRMGLPSFVRLTASNHVVKGRTGPHRSMNNASNDVEVDVLQKTKHVEEQG
jgi:hypothetical protein